MRSLRTTKYSSTGLFPKMPLQLKCHSSRRCATQQRAGSPSSCCKTIECCSRPASRGATRVGLLAPCCQRSSWAGGLQACCRASMQAGRLLVRSVSAAPARNCRWSDVRSTAEGGWVPTECSASSKTWSRQYCATEAGQQSRLKKHA